MSYKMSALLGVSLLCVFITNLPTAWSIECYSCHDYPGSTEPCSNGGTVQCESFYDSCMTITTTAEFYGTSYTSTLKNCSVLQYSCDKTAICNQVESAVDGAGGSMTHCAVNCCQGDLCNGQGGNQAKRRAALSVKKRGAMSLKGLGQAVKNIQLIQESLTRLVPQKR